jgi:Spy/CpxP family protein refolding chaperone
MTTRTIAAALGLAALALTSGTALAQTAAPAATPAAKPAHHPMSSKESTVDELNAQSLAAAQAGKDFTPAPPPATAPAKKM